MTTAISECFIKVREIGEQRRWAKGKWTTHRAGWKFLGSNGSCTRLRIHALRFTREQAEACIAENAADNPEWEWKISG